VIAPARLGGILLAVYLAALAAIVIFIVTAGGHMSPLLLSVAALPWSLLGHWLHRGWGLHLGTLLGLPLNAALAFALGYWLARVRA
jgi:hypothetical protein